MRRRAAGRGSRRRSGRCAGRRCRPPRPRTRDASATGWCGPASPARSAGPARRRRRARSGSRDRPPVPSGANTRGRAAARGRRPNPRSRRCAPARSARRPRCLAPTGKAGRPGRAGSCPTASAAPDWRRAHVPPGVGRGSPGRARCRDGATAPVPGSRRASPPARRHWCPGACRSRRAAPRARTPPPSRRRSAPCRPPGIRRRRRSANTGSSTVPTVFDRRRPSIAATALPTSLPRPRKRARSVSISTSPSASPSTTARWAAHSSGSSGLRRRRVARMAPEAGRYSVCTKSLEKAWCAESASGGASTISA